MDSRINQIKGWAPTMIEIQADEMVIPRQDESNAIKLPNCLFRSGEPTPGCWIIVFANRPSG